MKPAALYALHDYHEGKRSVGAQRLHNHEDAVEASEDGYGVFWVVNAFKGRRKTENLTEIRYWFCELDGADKADQVRRFQQAPLRPSLVVESKHGYHAYWKVRGKASLEQWKRIVRWGIVPALGGDPKSTDPLRLLRAPGYRHQKDPEDPFTVQVVWHSTATYTEEQMLEAFPDQSPPKPEPRPRNPNGTFWERVAALDGREAIERVSGHWLCRGEEFELKEQANGNANIIRLPDRYDTGCWVWSDGRLGGVDGGGSVAAWAKWYRWTWAEVARGLREVFPELDEEEAEETTQEA